LRNPGPEVRCLLGLAVLLAMIVPAYLASRPKGLDGVEASPGPSAEEGDDDARRVVDRLELDAHIRHVADRHGVPPRLVAAIIEVESKFNPRAVSRKGAQGLMQLMPMTAASLQIEDLFDPFENVEGGVRHLRRLMDRFRGNVRLVLAAYNAGEPAVIAYRGVPPYPETRRYVARVMRRYGRSTVATASVVAAGGGSRGTAELRRMDMSAEAAEATAPADPVPSQPRPDEPLIANDSP
jgi:transglycosylase-like protein with SLT domain